MRPCWIEVDLNCLAHNLTQIRKHTGTSKVMAVVKADAYGHGLIETAKLYQKLRVDWLAVALPQEGLEMRKAGITVPILVFGGLLREQIKELIEWNLDLTVSSLENLSWTEEIAQQMDSHARVHLKIDTGMGRIGTSGSETEHFIKKALSCQNLEIIGIYSHLACADDPESPMTLEQLKRYESALEYFQKHSTDKPLRHLANSGGILHFPQTHFDLVRPGIILYGVYPDPKSQRLLDLKPALSLKAQVVYSKKVKAGQPISYGATWAPEKDIEVSTIPLGYGDGFRRDLSNRGKILIQEEEKPIVGRVCMDQFMVNTGLQKISVGEEVVILGQQGNQSLSAEIMATELGTIPYEILTGLNHRIPRVYHPLLKNRLSL